MDDTGCLYKVYDNPLPEQLLVNQYGVRNLHGLARAMSASGEQWQLRGAAALEPSHWGTNLGPKIILFSGQQWLTKQFLVIHLVIWSFWTTWDALHWRWRRPDDALLTFKTFSFRFPLSCVLIIITHYWNILFLQVAMITGCLPGFSTRANPFMSSVSQHVRRTFQTHRTLAAHCLMGTRRLPRTVEACGNTANQMLHR